MTAETVFDIAGLTMPLVTAALAMKLLETGKIKLEDRACRYVQGFGVLGKSPISISNLLCHTSGLPAWSPFFEELLQANAGPRRGILTSKGAKDYIINAINRL